MDWLVKPLVWAYGRWFAAEGHTVFGYFAVCGAIAAALMIVMVPLWLYAVDSYREQHKTPTDQPAKVPTTLRIAFPGNGNLPTLDSGENVFRWYSLATVIIELPSNKETVVGWTIFLTFEKPIQSGSGMLTASFEGGPPPRYEVKDFSPRGAIVALTDSVPAGVLVLRVRYAP